MVDHERMNAECRVVDNQFNAATDTDFIAQYVYLYCVSHGLATVVRGTVDCEVLGRVMPLRLSQHIQRAQIVGYPPK